MKEISLGQVLLRLFQASRRFNVRIQPQLVLLQKTLLNVEGLGRQLNPDLDLWSTAKPILEKWMKEQVGFQALKNNIKLFRGHEDDLVHRFYKAASLFKARTVVRFPADNPVPEPSEIDRIIKFHFLKFILFNYSIFPLN